MLLCLRHPIDPDRSAQHFRPMNFASSVTREPIPYSSERGEEVLSLLDGLPSELRGLMRGMAGCSPYLAGLVQQERDWLREILPGTPEDAFGSVVQMLSVCPSDDLGAALRRAKRKGALLTAICDLGGIWRVQRVLCMGHW